MQSHGKSGYFSGFSTLSLIVGILFLCVCLIFWWFTRLGAIVLFGFAMLFGGLANGWAFHVLDRMSEAGYEIGYWRWFWQDLKVYSEYWRIAPQKGWSRSALTGALFCILLAAVFLLSIPIFAPNVPSVFGQ
jgi:hypothetical protein